MIIKSHLKIDRYERNLICRCTYNSKIKINHYKAVEDNKKLMIIKWIYWDCV